LSDLAKFLNASAKPLFPYHIRTKDLKKARRIHRVLKSILETKVRRNDRA